MKEFFDRLVWRVAQTIPTRSMGFADELLHLFVAVLAIAPAMAGVAVWVAVRVFIFTSVDALFVLTGTALYLFELFCVVVIYKAARVAEEEAITREWITHSLDRNVRRMIITEQSRRWRAAQSEERSVRGLLSRFIQWISVG